ncbi:MAG: DNA-formamidopyrimidine glycosylase [Candidatus Cloacimonetes bacterium]|nr:DNA-formamidopyrimidine glycosylase [Candidatus Cloacimonadota bacterium]
MPELPEVETIVRELRGEITGKELTEIISLRPGTVKGACKKESGTLGRINSVSRRGKYIILGTDSDLAIVIHLRMTGKLQKRKENEERPAHCRAELQFGDGSVYYFDDVRTFGKIEILESGNLSGALSKLGIEPFSAEFNAEYLSNRMHNRKAPIKSLLLDQSLIAGLGNIYVCEILHRCGIAPQREGNSLRREEFGKLAAETTQVLSEAIEKNGTTISDYRRVDNKRGEFQNFLRVYGKKDCVCGNKILRIKQSGRTSYYCPVCQQ